MSLTQRHIVAQFRRMLDGDPLAFTSDGLSDEALGRFRRAQIEDSNQDPRAALYASFVTAALMLGCASGPAVPLFVVWGVAYLAFWMAFYKKSKALNEAAQRENSLPSSHTETSVKASLAVGVFWGVAAVIAFGEMPMSQAAAFASLSVMLNAMSVAYAGTQFLSVLSMVIPCTLGAWIGLALNGGPGSGMVALLYLVLVAGAIDTSRKATQRLARRVAAHVVADRTARTDTLTGLGNRKAFEERLDAFLRELEQQGGPFALVLFDLNGLKRINDTYGHEAGDALIRHMGDVLGANARDKLDFAYRLGGDEFVLIVTETEGLGPAVTVHKTIESFCAPKDLGWGLFVPSTSVGVAVAPRDGRDASKLMRAADAAMYFNKRRGVSGLSAYELFSERRADLDEFRAAG